MARLIDWIMDAGKIIDYPDDKTPALMEGLTHCPKIICDEAGEYWYQERFKGNTKITEFADIDISTFNCIHPPFENLWMEYKIPQSNITTGAYVFFLTADESQFGRDTVWFIIFAGNKDGICFCGSEWMQINNNGRPYNLKQKDSHNPQQLYSESAGVDFAFYLSLLNANVPVEDSPAYDAPLQKARQRRGKLPFFEYKILSLKPDQAKAKAKAVLSAVSTGGKNRRHSVRGHQRVYTAEKPMFGRKNGVGTFWIPEYIAGSKDAGTIVKDYALKAPKPVESEKFQTKVVLPFSDT